MTLSTDFLKSRPTVVSVFEGYAAIIALDPSLRNRVYAMFAFLVWIDCQCFFFVLHLVNGSV